MSVGRICKCKAIVMPDEAHACVELEAAAAIDNSRRHRKQRAHGRDRRAWRDGLRLRVLERDDWTCQLQLDTLCGGDATTVHLSQALAGDHGAATEDDCVAACAHCHGVVDAPRAAAARGVRGVGRTADSSARPAPRLSRVLASSQFATTGNTDAATKLALNKAAGQ